MNEPKVGDIWQWMDHPPVLLLFSVDADLWEEPVKAFETLQLTTGQRIAMVFGPSVMDRWRQLA